MVDPEGVELLELVSRRADLLAALDVPRHKRDLAAELPTSRSTVDRALRELEVASLVERRDGRYQTTLAGRLASAGHDHLVETLADVGSARELLAHLPREVDVAPAFLRGATVNYPETPVPRQPLLDLWEYIRAADHHRGLATAVLETEIAERMHELALTDGIDFEYVYDGSIAEYLRTEHADRLVETLEHDNRLYVAESIPLELGVISGERGTHAYLVSRDDRGEFRGVAINDTPAAVEWAEELFERYRDRATELTVPDLRD
jgi:predicted transcriptional regulator